MEKCVLKVNKKDRNHLIVSSQARQELNPSQVTAYLRIKREPPEVEDTCISGDSSQGSAEQIIRNRS